MQSMSNLDCFLHRTTPVAPSKFLQQNEIRNLNRLWNRCDKEAVEYFSLSDLWNCFNEWSAYGVGVPIHLNDEDTLVQYYVPYLSAIQIFTSNTFREEIECGDSETRESLSDSYSDDSECDKLWTSSEEGESVWNLDDRLGHLYFQYFEKSTPYERVPLMDKINELAERYSGLMSLKSVDLSPASWMAVSWYPIYHIPMRTIKDLSTCFLTYHTLSSSFQDMDRDDEMEGMQEKKKKGEAICLAPFGLATYKMQGNNLWVSGKCGRDQEKVVSLCSVADSWLKQLNVHHHDFNYFMGTRHG